GLTYADAEHLEDVVAVREDAREFEARKPVESLQEAVRVRDAAGILLVEHLQPRKRERRHEFVRPVVVAEAVGVTTDPLAVPPFRAEHADLRDAVVDVVAVRDEEPALGSGERLCRIQRERADVAKRTDGTATVPRRVRLGAILDECETF